MSITLSHQTSLYVTRWLRAEGIDLRHEVEHAALSVPATWHGDRWSISEFSDDRWHWYRPSAKQPLHVLIPKNSRRIRMDAVVCHRCNVSLPSTSILWLDDVSRTVCPEMLFAQMAQALTLPELVMLGNELCGSFTRSAERPLDGPVTDKIPPATSVEELDDFLYALRGMRGVARAREALRYVVNDAVSLPEALLAMIYSLPSDELGYGMGPVTLNREMEVPLAIDPLVTHRRYPDLMLPIAPIGINYEGEVHLDLDGLIGEARATFLADAESWENAQENLASRKAAVRAKYVDDMRRNREFLAQGSIVLPMVKEDLYGRGNLDNFTRMILACARNFYGVDTAEYEKALDDTSLCMERYTLLSSLLPKSRERD